MLLSAARHDENGCVLGGLGYRFSNVDSSALAWGQQGESKTREGTNGPEVAHGGRHVNIVSNQEMTALGIAWRFPKLVMRCQRILGISLTPQYWQCIQSY